MQDKIETIGKGSVIQHGKHNNRIYLMKLLEADAEDMVWILSKMAHQNKYTKIFCKVPKKLAPLFIADGYLLESYIPQFYKGVDDVFFMSKYLSSDRLLFIEKDELSKFSHLLSDASLFNSEKELKTSGYEVLKLNKSYANRISSLYKGVFKSYPFPIESPDYIKETMDSNVQYFGAIKDGELAALGSSEIDFNYLNAEMTDFATNQEHLGNGLSQLILENMEKEMEYQGIKTLYTIARLKSIAMNKTFLKAGYTYSGTLIKNTNIAGSIESMNVLYKPL